MIAAEGATERPAPERAPRGAGGTVSILAALAGILLLAWLVYEGGAEEVGRRLVGLGPVLPLALLPYTVVSLCDALGCRCGSRHEPDWPHPGAEPSRRLRHRGVARSPRPACRRADRARGPARTDGPLRSPARARAEGRRRADGGARARRAPEDVLADGRPRRAERGRLRSSPRDR